MVEVSTFVTIIFAFAAIIFSHFFGIVDFDYFNSLEYKYFKSLSSLTSRSNALFKHSVLGFDAVISQTSSIEKVGLDLQKYFLSSTGGPITSVEAANISSLLKLHYELDSFGRIYIPDSSAFERLKKHIGQEGTKFSVVGTVYEFAQVFLNFEVRVKLGAPINKEVLDLANWHKSQDMVFVLPKCSSEVADFQVTIEWNASDLHFLEHRSELPRRGNRVEFFPPANLNVECLEKVFEMTAAKDVDLVVIGGLSRLQFYPRKDYVQVLGTIREHLKQIKRKIVVHLEVDLLQSDLFIKDLANNIFPFVNSIGIGEDVILKLNKGLNGPHSEFSVDSGIAVAGGAGLVSDILTHMFAKYVDDMPSSRLSRIFFHSYSFQVSAVKASLWKNTREAMARASLHASKKLCNLESSLDLSNKRIAMPNYFTLSKSESVSVAALDPYNPVISWTKKQLTFYAVPILVCNESKGLNSVGVSSSAVSLLFSQYTVYNSVNKGPNANYDL